MKYFFLLLVSFCFAVSLKAREPVYPQLRTVIDKLFNSYNVPETTAESNLHFAKKPDGWFVQWTDQTKVPEKVISEELFWSAKKSKFVKLRSIKPGKTSIAEGKKNSMYSYSETYTFSRCVYWGYIGWDKDVIRNFAAKKELTDTLLESLGRAYANYSHGFTDHSYGFHLVNKDLDEKMKMDSFMHYQQLDIATFDRLRKQNPNYEMIAGNSNTKYAGEVMAFFDYLQLFGKENIAAPYFREELFDAIILANAKSMLSSCDSNAILFTNGDNDTFPLEYLQFIKGFRTDIIVMNLSMMNLSSILEQAVKGKGKALPVKFSFDMNKYSNAASAYFKEENVEPDPISYEKLLSKLYSQDPNSEVKGSEYYNFPKCTLSFPNQRPFFKNFENPVNDSIAYLYLDKAYLLRSDFAQIDIIISNLGERPIYYAVTASDPGMGINDYLFGEGMVLHFIPLKTQGGNSKLTSGANVLKEVSFDNMMEVNFNYSSTIDRPTGERFVANFKIQYILLAYSLTTEQPEKAIRLLDYCDSLFPPGQWEYEYDPFWAYGVQAYYECQQKGKGDRIALQMLDDFEKKLANKKAPPDEDEKLNMYRAIMLIKNTAEEFSRGIVLARAEKYLEKNKIE